MNCHSFSWGVTKKFMEDVSQSKFCSTTHGHLFVLGQSMRKTWQKKTSPKQKKNKNLPKKTSQNNITKTTSIFSVNHPPPKKKKQLPWSLPLFLTLFHSKNFNERKPPRCATWSPISIQHLDDFFVVGDLDCVFMDALPSSFWKVSPEEKESKYWDVFGKTGKMSPYLEFSFRYGIVMSLNE